MSTEQSFKLKNKLPPYTQIPNDLITGSLSPLAKATYCYLASRPDDWDFWFTNIVIVMHVGVSSVKKALKELVDSGWVERQQSRSGGRWGATVYQVNYIPWVENRTTVAVPPLPCYGMQPTYKDLLVKKIKNKDNSLASQTKERGESFHQFKNKLLKQYPNFMFSIAGQLDYNVNHIGFCIKNDCIYSVQTQKFLEKEESFKIWEYLYKKRERVFDLAQAQVQTKEIA